MYGIPGGGGRVCTQYMYVELEGYRVGVLAGLGPTVDIIPLIPETTIGKLYSAQTVSYKR